jgi:predicted phage terminase large subunit-like protein
MVLISLDTALSQKEAANYSAYTVWGVFVNQVDTLEGPVSQDSMILLGSDKGHWDLTELCNKMQELNTIYAPEYFVVEDTSAGMLLIPEMQKRSLPVLPYKPKGDKTFRLQACTPYFQARRVVVPRGKVWADAVIEEVCAFQPRLKNQKDDLTDCVSSAVIWMRDNFKIDNDGFSNRWDDEIYVQRRRTYWNSLMPKS